MRIKYMRGSLMLVGLLSWNTVIGAEDLTKAPIGGAHSAFRPYMSATEVESEEDEWELEDNLPHRPKCALIVPRSRQIAVVLTAEQITELLAEVTVCAARRIAAEEEVKKLEDELKAGAERPTRRMTLKLVIARENAALKASAEAAALGAAERAGLNVDAYKDFYRKAKSMTGWRN